MTKTLKRYAKSDHLSAFSLVVLFCFFFSGLAGLIYQILWLRMIDKVVGSAPFAVATVLSVFMGGLALGSFLAGRYIDRINSRSNLLSLYGKVELAIGLYGLLLPLLIYIAKPVYVLAYNSLFTHFLLYRLFTFLGCSLLLIAPTTLMGVTLPLLCRFYVEDLGHIGARTGRLYGINTIGGAAGAVICGFFLIAEAGVWGTLITAVCINILIGVLCIGIGKRDTPLVPEPLNKTRVKTRPPEPQPPVAIPLEETRIITWSLWIFGISGFCSMAYEVFWTRLLGLIIGPTTYSFSLVVATFIVGLAIGNILFGWLADRIKGVFRLLVITQACAACLTLLVSQFLGNSQFFFSKLIYTFQGAFGERVLAQSVVLFFILVGPTILLGATFPLVNRIYARSLSAIGRSIGNAYSVNTIGAILGSFVAGFLLIPLIGKENGLRITAGFQFFTSLLAIAYLSFRSQERLRASITGAVALALGILLLLNFPTWNHNILSRGWYYRFEAFTQYFSTTSWFDAIWQGPSRIAKHISNNQLVFYGDGIGGFTTVEKWVNPTGTANYTMLNSGKMDASSHNDRLTQSLSAHIPLLFHPAPEKVMILGLASGMTAGEALLYPVKQLDVLEINDQVVKAAELFNPWNNNCITNPRARIIIQDGRNHLELTRERYDVIISEPSNPWMAGLANLFTLEYFKTVRARLNKDGIFIQWTNAYDMDWDSFAMIGRTFAEAFPDGLLIRTISSSDFLLVGFSGKRNMDLKTAEKNIVYARQSKNVIIRDPRIIFNLVVTDDLKGFFGSGPLHTDNWPHLEFAAPKNIGHNTAIAEKIKNNSLIFEETKKIIESNKDIDPSLDSLELLTAGYSPPFKDIGLDKATTTQTNRYHEILKGYCTDEYVTEYSIFPDGAQRKECAQLQVKRIQEHLAISVDDSIAYYSLALALKETGKIQEEIDALKKAISLNPSFQDAHMQLGSVLGAQGCFEDAVARLSEALRLNPGSAETHNNLGNVLADQGKTAEAIEHFLRAIELDPDLASAHNNLGSVLADQGRTSEAIEHFLKALRIAPDNFLAHYNLGVAWLNQGQAEEAAGYFLKAAKINPVDPETHKMLGMTFGLLGRLNEAAEQFTEALKLEPDNAETHDNLGVTLLKMGQTDEAIGHFKKALDIDSSFETAKEHLNTAQMELGR